VKFATYPCGSAVAGDIGFAVTTDNSGATLVAGSTGSPDSPVRNAYRATKRAEHDAFVAKFNLTGELVYSTYLGGNGEDVASAVVVDADGAAIVVGETQSLDFPTSRPTQADSRSVEVALTPNAENAFTACQTSVACSYRPAPTAMSDRHSAGPHAGLRRATARPPHGTRAGRRPRAADADDDGEVT
jgi:hypothetical protein